MIKENNYAYIDSQNLYLGVRGTCSMLLKNKAKEKLVFMNNLKNKLEYKRKNTA